MSLGYLHQIYSDNENKTVREELKDSFIEINKLEKKLVEAEKNMNIDQNNIKVIEEYTSLLDQFNNI